MQVNQSTPTLKPISTSSKTLPLELLPVDVEVNPLEEATELQTESQVSITKESPQEAKKQNIEKLNEKESLQHAQIEQTERTLQSVMDKNQEAVRTQIVNDSKPEDISQQIIEEQQKESSEEDITEDAMAQEASNIDTPEELTKVMHQITKSDLNGEEDLQVLSHCKKVLEKGLERLKGELTKEKDKGKTEQLKSEIKEVNLNLGKIEQKTERQTELTQKRSKLEELKTKTPADTKAIEKQEKKIANLEKRISKLENNLKTDYQKFGENPREILKTYTLGKTDLALIEIQKQILEYFKKNGVTDQGKLANVAKLIEESKAHSATGISIKPELKSKTENPQNYKISSVSTFKEETLMARSCHKGE